MFDSTIYIYVWTNKSNTQIRLEEQCETVESELQIVKRQLLDANTDNRKKNEKIAELKVENQSLNIQMVKICVLFCYSWYVHIYIIATSYHVAIYVAI